MQSNGPGFAAFIPLLVMTLPLIFICHRLAKDKGKNVALYTILGIIPLVNYYILFYLVGTTNKAMEEKIDKVLSIIEGQKVS